MKYFTQKYIESCGCRSVGECTHNLFAEPTALADLTKDFSEAIRVKIMKKLPNNFMTGLNNSILHF